MSDESNRGAWRTRRAKKARAGFGLTRLRDPIEAAFGRYARVIYRNAGRVVIAVVLVVAALCTQLPLLEVETSTEGMLPPDDPIIVSYDAFRERYGRDQVILVAIQTEDVFDLDFLNRLRTLHLELESEVPYIEEVESLVTVRDTRGERDRLVVGDLLDPWPESEADLDFVRERVRTNPMLENFLISKSGRMTTILVRPDVYTSIGVASDELAGFEDESSLASGEDAGPPPYMTGQENTEVVRAVSAVVARHQAPDFKILIAGQPVMVDYMMRAMMEDMARFTAASLLVIAVSLGLLFQRFAAVFLPLVVSGLAMLSTVSVMAILGIPMTTTTQIMPSFLLAVGVGGAVHILAIFYQSVLAGQSKEDAVAAALSHSGLAVVMTSLTTAGGLLSFAMADIAPIQQLGIVTPIGIVGALLFTLVLLPALIALVPMSARAGTRRRMSSPVREVLIACGEFSTGRPWTVISVCAVLLLIAAVGAGRLDFSHDPIAWFPEDAPLRIAVETIDEELAGMMYVDAVIESGRPGAAKDPAFLERIVEISNYAMADQGLGIAATKAMSIVEVAKETHRALNENRTEFYTIPQDRELLAQELLLFESSGADELEKLVDTQFSEVRLTLTVPMVDAVYYDQVLDDIEERGQEIFGDTASFTLTGEARMMTRLLSLLTSNLIRTYILAFLIIAPLMILLLGSLRMGLISMIPNLTPVALTLGIMGWVGIPLELFTLLIGSIALGLAVDDTVHFMHNFRRYYEQGGDVREAVRRTLSTTGQALLFTSIVLASGFFIYMFSTMSNLLYFGFLTGCTIIFAFLADLFLAPALMALLAEYIAQPLTDDQRAEAS